ncbi:MAG: M1 family metallopeptidase, partial [Balneolaceae bacterium]|nr:M1 family metallopeptidase [Balneolaceae bacterium]
MLTHRFHILLLTLLMLLISIDLTAQRRGYWQQKVEYQMDIDVDAEQHQFDGYQKAVYYNNSPDTLHRIFYHLYFNAFQPGSMMDVRSRTISDPDRRVRDRIYHLTKEEVGFHKIGSVKQDGQPSPFKVDGTILEVELTDPIPPGSKTVMELEFKSQVPLQIRRSGRDNKEGVEFSMSQWYPKISEYDHKGWHPNPYVGREFYGIWGDFDVRISIDSSYVLGATGHLQNPQQIGHGYQENGSTVNRPDSEKLTWHWKAENVHDFMWGADPDFVHTIRKMENGPELHFLYQVDPVAVDSGKIAQDTLKSNWERLPDYTADAFRFVNKHFGKYPYKKFSVIQGGDGGMEYPMGTLITGNRSLRSLVGVTVHELIHMWYYGVLGTNESLYAWMDEGFTTYASALTMDHLFNENPKHPHHDAYEDYFEIVQQGLEEPMDTHADHFHTNRAYGRASYDKGAVFLNQLRYIIGDQAFDAGMKKYFRQWKFKHPTGQDFLRVMEQESGMVLDWYYQYFIETTKTIDYGISSVLGIDGNTYVTLERHNLMPMPIDLVVEYADGSSELYYIPLRITRGEKP